MIQIFILMHSIAEPINTLSYQKRRTRASNMKPCTWFSPKNCLEALEGCNHAGQHTRHEFVSLANLDKFIANLRVKWGQKIVAQNWKLLFSTFLYFQPLLAVVVEFMTIFEALNSFFGSAF